MKETSPDDNLISLEKTIEILSVSRSTVYRFIKRKKLKGYNVGKSLRFYEKDVRALIQPINVTEVDGDETV
jgi:excisionase family DNA binding protein